MATTTQPLTQSGSGTFTTQSIGMEGVDAPFISTRWLPLHVSTIESIHIVNKRYYQEEDRSNCPYAQGLCGKLKEADLKVTFTLPYAVSKSQLSSYIQRCTGLFSEDIDVKIGCLTDMTTMEPKLQEPQKFSVLIPLIRGMMFRKPMFDYISTSQCDWVHFTLEFPGAVWPTMKPATWRIRIKVCQMEDKIECVSVSSSPLDVTRMKESWFNVGSWLKDLPRKLSPFLPFNRSALGYPSYQQQQQCVYGQQSYGCAYQQQFQPGMNLNADKSGIGMNLSRGTPIPTEVYQQ